MVALEATVSAIGYIALACLLGQLVAAGFLLPNGEPKELRRSLIAWALISLLVFLGAYVLVLFVQGAKIQRGMPSSELLLRYLTMTQSGQVWIARETYGAVLTLLTWMLAGRESSPNAIRFLAVLALPLVASRSLTSHAVAVREDRILTVSSDALHLLATALWAGGLMGLWRLCRLAVRERNQSLARTEKIVKRFSRLALASVALLAVTGLYQSSVHVGALETLVNTNYGKVLLFKLLLFSVMLGFGALNFLSTRRMLARAVSRNENGYAASHKALRRIGLETFVGLLIFCVTGLLTVLPPGIHAVHQPAAATGQPKGLTITDSTKRFLPADGASVKILAPQTGQVFAGDKVPLRFNLTKGKRGHHVHAYVDGELMGMFQSKAGTLNGLTPGRHLLELRVVAENHQTELDASDRVEFMVK
jgi:putative copper export protein